MFRLWLQFGLGIDKPNMLWRSFFRKCHALGVLERKLCNLAKSNQHYAIMAVYAITWKGQTIINNEEPVMVLNSEDDVVRHKKSPNK